MSDQYVGEIRLFGGNYPPKDWAICNGTTLPITDYPELFSLIGATYGGDGRTDFALPDLRGRLPMHYGMGPGLTNRLQGSFFGAENVTLNLDQIPAHSHIFYASSDAALELQINGNVLAETPANDNFYAPESTTNPPLEVQLIGNVIGNTGGNGAHSNIMPVLAVNYIIALKGIYPQRS